VVVRGAVAGDPGAAGVTPPMLDRPRVAVINDSERFKTAIQRALERDGYDAPRFRAGIGVHEVVRALAPAAIAIDIACDGVDRHWRTLEALVDDPVLVDVPIVLSVAEVPTGDRHRTLLLRAGLVLLHHPVTAREIVRAVRDMLAMYGAP
jgi:CheY-like chemotaxis protein